MSIRAPLIAIISALTASAWLAVPPLAANLPDQREANGALTADIVLADAKQATAGSYSARLQDQTGTGLLPGDTRHTDRTDRTYSGSMGDSDGDGIVDNEDNCVNAPNPSQRDTDADKLGNACDPDIALPNDCRVNFLDLNVFRLAFFSNPALSNWNADADTDGDNAVNFADLRTVKHSFLGRPGPSGVPSACPHLGEGEPCDPDASLCQVGLACCYPCGVPGCEDICEVVCDPAHPACVDGCLLRP